MFRHNLLKFDNIDQINTDHGRFYKTPEGNLYPSVTTVIGSMSDKSWLEEWKSKIGAEEAARVSARATIRGSKVHDLCERFVSNEDIDFDSLDPFNSIMFYQLKKVISERIDDVRAIEARLYSHKLKVAGSVDLIANFDNKLSVIDYKTSNKIKRIEDIEGYFIQTAMYSMMLYEMTGLIANQLVVLICVEDSNHAQIFTQNISDWIKPTMKMCKDFHSKK